ncbi:MAG: hypothetical protein KHZ62_00675 [Clostridiales bacterium]|nr:hypothetical protein [Clostridiales bacterium]
MAEVRPINEKRYGVSKHKFLETYHFCLQYNEWLRELQVETDTVQSPVLTDLPPDKTTRDKTGMLAVKRAQLDKKRRLVEETAREAAPEIFPWLLKAVTTNGASYIYLKERMDIPCGKDLFYDRRRKFYWLLANKL